MLTLGIDIGGTFTDVTLADESADEISLGKELTSAQSPAVGALEGARTVLEENDATFADVETIIHGTTLVSNTLIEKTGATTGLLATRGTKDVLEIRRSFRYDIYDWQIEYPDPLVPRDRRVEVDERIGPDGEVREELDMESVDEAVETLVSDHGVTSIAVSFLHSYVDDSHEKRVKERIESTHEDVDVTLSSEVAPVIREYERTSTTVINAYVKPTIQEHLAFFQERLDDEGFAGEFYMMTSNSGIVDAETATDQPVLLVESGPAAGVLKSQQFADAHRMDNVFSFDMGGTTAKGSIVEDGKVTTTNQTDIAREHRFKEGSGYPVLTPMIDITEIGAGGGSIADVSDVGLVTVGPESAGSDPGPVCYDLGGTRPTVTDAALILGYLDPENFFGGRMTLDDDAARNSIREHLADPLGISVRDAAWQVFEVVTENMANAFHRHATSQGIDPRELSMVSLGGAGPMTAFGVAPKVGIDEIYCPAGAGVGSAIGLTNAPKLYEASATKQDVLATLSAEDLAEQFSSLYEDAAGVLRRANADEETLEAAMSLDMRHVNQGHEIEVTFPDTSMGDVTPETARKRFHATYQELYNREPLDYPIEIMNYRIRLQESVTSVIGGSVAGDGQDGGKTSRNVYFGDDSERTADIYQWSKLEAGQTFDGPAIVEGDRTTAVADPETCIRVTDDLALEIRQS